MRLSVPVEPESVGLAEGIETQRHTLTFQLSIPSAEASPG